MIDAVGCNKKVITYQKKKAKEQILNMNAFASMDVKSFNQKIGVITNIASNMISMKSVYKSDEPEYIELDKRIRMNLSDGTIVPLMIVFSLIVISLKLLFSSILSTTEATTN